jgi:hypothetical protein
MQIASSHTAAVTSHHRLRLDTLSRKSKPAHAMSAKRKTPNTGNARAHTKGLACDRNHPMLLRYSPAARCEHKVDYDPDRVGGHERDIEGLHGTACWAI